MQDGFYQKVSTALSVERLGTYGEDGAEPCTVLSRYLWNMALCESLYSPLQLCEVGLRNSLHRTLEQLYGVDWFDNPAFDMTVWGKSEIAKAKIQLAKDGKASPCPAQVEAELQFGFWCHLFEGHYEFTVKFVPQHIKMVFPRLPKSLHNRKSLKHRLETIRQLRNRIFHHERIVHWKDIVTQHDNILETIGWISPELNEMTRALDKFKKTHADGIDPWKAKIRSHWPKPPATDAQAGAPP